MVLTNLVLEGMAHPLYSYEERYWKPVDPYLARLVRGAFIDETRHVAFGAGVVRRFFWMIPPAGQRPPPCAPKRASRCARCSAFTCGSL